MTRSSVCVVLCVVACAKTGPPTATPVRPGRVEVLLLDTDGAARVGRRQRSEDPCDWELVVAEGRGWGPWTTTPGRPSVVGGPGGELVAWSSCGGDDVSWLVVGDSPDLHAQVPPQLTTVAWIDGRTVQLTGADPVGVRFGLRAGEWVSVPVDCVPLAIDAAGDTLRSGERVSLLLLGDLGADARDEWVVEEPDSCGTARCTATVYTPCAADGLARPIGTLDHRDGVRAGAATHGGWVELHTVHAEGGDRWRMVDGTYARVGDAAE